MSRVDLLTDDIEVTKDGLTYEIGRTHREQRVQVLLRDSPDGWAITVFAASIAIPESHRLGRRASWIKALHDALVWIDAAIVRDELAKAAAGVKENGK